MMSNLRTLDSGEYVQHVVTFTEYVAGASGFLEALTVPVISRHSGVMLALPVDFILPEVLHQVRQQALSR